MKGRSGSKEGQREEANAVESSSSSSSSSKKEISKLGLGAGLGFGNLHVLGESVLNNCILQLLEFKELISLAQTSSRFRNLIFSLDCPVWMMRPMCICIDSSCFGCGRDQIQTALAVHLLKIISLNHLRLHTPTCLLDGCLENLCKVQKLNKLHLRLRNDNFGRHFNALSRTPLAQASRSRSNDDFLGAIIDTKESYELHTLNELHGYYS